MFGNRLVALKPLEMGLWARLLTVGTWISAVFSSLWFMAVKGANRPQGILLRLDPVLRARLDCLAAARNLDRTALLREAVEAYVVGVESGERVVEAVPARRGRPPRSERVQIARGVVADTEARVGVKPRSWRA